LPVHRLVAQRLNIGFDSFYPRIKMVEPRLN
jgi:hypothetical protein